MSRFIIAARSPKTGAKLYYTVKQTLATRGRSRKFESLDAAWSKARELLRAHPQLRDYTLHAQPLTPVKVNPRARKRKNPSGYEKARDSYLQTLDKAADRFETFTGRPATKEKRFALPRVTSGFELGPLVAVTYEQDRGDGLTHYEHTFKKSSRPLLVSSSDGKVLSIVGGRYEIDPELGVVDV